MSNAINPEHYNRLNPQPKDVIRAWGLNFNLGSAVKYISRAGHKDDIVGFNGERGGTGKIVDIKDEYIYVDESTLFHSCVSTIPISSIVLISIADPEHIEDKRRA